MRIVTLVAKQKQMMPAHQMVQAVYKALLRGRPSTSPLPSVDPPLTGLSTRCPAVWAKRSCTLSGAACSAGELRQRTTWTVRPPLGPSDTYGIFLSLCNVLPSYLPLQENRKKTIIVLHQCCRSCFVPFSSAVSTVVHEAACCALYRIVLEHSPYFPADILMCLSVSGAWPRVHPIDCCSLLVFRAQGQHWQGQPGSGGDVLR